MTLPAPDDPLTPAEIEALFAPLVGRRLLVGWSGGPDSTTLVALLTPWARRGNASFATATVDHGLREGSRQEAEWVHRQALRHGVEHVVLSWEGVKPATGVQAAARSARYALLAEEARRIGADTLVMGHTLDDQAETILMRLARGSGLDGLRGMRMVSSREGLGLVRPLLAVPKSRLLASCDSRWSYVTDPLNSDPRFTRARWRKLMPLLAAEGLTAERLARFAERAGAAQDAIDWQGRHWQRVERDETAPGTLKVDVEVYRVAPTPLLISLLIRVAPPQDGRPPRLERYERAAVRLHEAIRQSRPFRTTLSGRTIRLTRDLVLLIAPEPQRRRGRPASRS